MEDRLQGIHVRRAQPTAEDAFTLYHLEASTLKDSQRSPEEMQSLLARPEHHIYIAYDDQVAIGFCATFETASPQGKRLEVDMLGVVKAWQGRGVGTRLVQAAVKGAAEQGVQYYRAVVAQNNLASRRVFEHCEFRALAGGYEMLVYPILGNVPQPYLPEGWRQTPVPGSYEALWPRDLLRYQALEGYTTLFIQDAQGRPVGGAALLLVHTLAYEGMWIEAQWARHQKAACLVARAAVEHAKMFDCDEVGFLLPEDAPSWLLWAYIRQGFQQSGRYWVMEKGLCGSKTNSS